MSENVFVQNRKISATEKRIKIILWYVIECYLLVLKNQEKYSKIYVKNKTSYGYKFENYLRTRLVDDYLNKNKDLLHKKTSNLNEINFTKESEEEYSQNNKTEIDKIDIYVSNLGLQKEWTAQNENPYFAIECKRIKDLSESITGSYGYISDIEKFCNRPYILTRLPFEGQIAFIENKKIGHTTLHKKINDILETHKTIKTNSFLNPIVLSDKFDGTYLSKHKRKNNQNFSIYHLLFNYSDIIVD